MGVLAGDTGGSGAVNGTDVSQTKLQSGQPVTGSNFRTDVGVNGAINGTDVSCGEIEIGYCVAWSFAKDSYDPALKESAGFIACPGTI